MKGSSTRRRRIGVALCAGLGLAATWAVTPTASAASSVGYDKALFLSSTGAHAATGPLPLLPTTSAATKVGELTFSICADTATCGTAFSFGQDGGDWSRTMEGNDL